MIKPSRSAIALAAFIALTGCQGSGEQGSTPAPDSVVMPGDTMPMGGVTGPTTGTSSPGTGTTTTSM